MCGPWKCNDKQPQPRVTLGSEKDPDNLLRSQLVSGIPSPQSLNEIDRLDLDIEQTSRSFPCPTPVSFLAPVLLCQDEMRPQISGKGRPWLARSFKPHLSYTIQGKQECLKAVVSWAWNSFSVWGAGCVPGLMVGSGPLVMSPGRPCVVC